VKRLIATWWSNGLKKQTIHNILTPLKEAYQHAMDEGLLTMNPVARTGRLTRSKDDPRTTITPLTTDEVRIMLDVAFQQAPDTLYPVLLCAVRTGMREGELIGVQWGDVDLHGGFLEIKRAVVRGKDTSTKTHKIRRVEMTPQLQAVLTRLKEIRTVEAMAAARTLTEYERVFLSQTGEQWADQTLRPAFNRCLNAAGVRHIGLHVLRHTYASLLIQQGAPAKYIQEQLGHGSIGMTLNTYSHLFPGDHRHYVNKLDDPQDNRASESGPMLESATSTQPDDEVHSASIA